VHWLGIPEALDLNILSICIFFVESWCASMMTVFRLFVGYSLGAVGTELSFFFYYSMQWDWAVISKICSMLDDI
jgi:hypothetical protein